MNYFNYFTEIEDTFVRRRGKHLFLSPMDWALMETWKQQGIPLHIVLRGIERSFDSFESRPRKRTVKSLLYCQEEVEAQYAEWTAARVGASSATGSADSEQTPFSLQAISEHLQRNFQVPELQFVPFRPALGGSQRWLNRGPVCSMIWQVALQVVFVPKLPSPNGG